MDYRKNISILGGGTAGWLTALYVKKIYPDKEITLIESSDKGILGAGEGTTPYFIYFLDMLGIPFSDLVRECKATIKNGVTFSNWSNCKSLYMNDFYHNLNEINSAYKEGHCLNDFGLYPNLTLENKVPFEVNYNHNILTGNPILGFNAIGNWACHFDAKLLAEYLKKIGLRRGINLIDGLVTDFKQNESGDICEIICENVNLKTEFVFDCSGFARVILGKFFQENWVSFKNELPLDSAVPFFITSSTDKMAPRTEAIARKYGWEWKIPVQDRYGCGYVFDSKMISQDQAVEELESIYGYNLDVKKCFKFEPGTFRKTIVSNVMAVGLAQSFVEPLEATSIWVSILNLTRFIDNEGLDQPSNSIVHKKLNERFYNLNLSVKDFLHFHYFMSDRTDSDFWKNFNSRYTNNFSTDVYKFLSQNPRSIDTFEDIFMTYTDFSTTNWLNVFLGNFSTREPVFKEILDSKKYNVKHYVSKFIKHSDFLEVLKNGHK